MRKKIISLVVGLKGLSVIRLAGVFRGECQGNK